MSKSLDYCKEIATNPARSSYGDRDFSQTWECDIKELIDESIISETFESHYYNAVGIAVPFEYSISLDPEADFNYTVNYSSLNDGTLFFLYEGIDDVLRKVLTGSSYNTSIGLPEKNESIHYTIGNPIYIIEVDKKFAPEDKPWAYQRNTIMLPVRYERRKRNEL